MKNSEEKLEMIKDLWITYETLKFYRPKKGTHEAFHVADTTNWIEGKLNLLILSIDDTPEISISPSNTASEEIFKNIPEISLLREAENG